MAYIDNTQTNKELNEAIRGNAVSNIAPVNIAGQVIPVININPKDYKNINIIRRATSNTTMYTTPTDRDFYLCAVHLDISHSAASTNGSAALTVTPKGQNAQTIASLSYITSALIDTASKSDFFVFNKPILLERGSTIVSGSVGTAPSVRTYEIYGYIDE